MKKLFLLFVVAFCFYCFYSCNNQSKKTEEKSITKDSTNVVSKSNESTTEFPYEKAKQAVLEKMSGGLVYGYYKESDTKVYLYLKSSSNEDWIQEFVLLNYDGKEPVWFMGQKRELSQTRFKRIE